MRLKELREWSKHVGERVRVEHRGSTLYYVREGFIEGITKKGHLKLRERDPLPHDSGVTHLHYTHIRTIESVETEQGSRKGGPK